MLPTDGWYFSENTFALECREHRHAPGPLYARKHTHRWAWLSMFNVIRRNPFTSELTRILRTSSTSALPSVTVWLCSELLMSGTEKGRFPKSVGRPLNMPNLLPPKDQTLWSSLKTNLMITNFSGWCSAMLATPALTTGGGDQRWRLPCPEFGAWMHRLHHM